MNEQIKRQYEERAIILENLDAVLSNTRKSNKSQLSLFADQINESISLKMPEVLDFNKIAEDEEAVLGICLSYNKYDKYILHKLTFCNSTVRSVNQTTEDNQNLIFIGTIKTINYLKSKFGNNYAKVTIRDYDSTLDAYIFGDVYKNNISSMYVGREYLFKVSYSQERQSVTILKIAEINTLDLNEYIDSIILTIKEDLKSVIQVKELTNVNSIHYCKDAFGVMFLWHGKIYPHPTPVKFDEEFYLNIKDHILDINIERKIKVKNNKNVGKEK